ncbi:hypothetical protein [Streptomyces sp. NPDC058664]|uniref:hypothetical protein n=1 Tax=unclassified Streptomyces TaxID=2593676 RepID=UPI003659ABF1
MQAKLNSSQSHRITDAQALAVPARLGTQDFSTHRQTLDKLALRAGQIPAATPPTRIVIHYGTVKPYAALWALGRPKSTRMGPAIGKSGHKDWKIFAARYRGPLTRFALIAKIVTALAFYKKKGL